MSRSRHLMVVSAAAVLLASSAGLRAQDPQAPVDDSVVLESTAGAGQNGRLAVNIAAGSLNQQASSLVLAQGEVAATREKLTQRSDAGEGEDRATRIVVGEGVFAGHSGVASINITAGTGNQSANLASIAIGQAGALSDQMLEQARAPIEPSGGPTTTASGRNDFIDIDDGAFAGGSGVLQANLIGGERNSSANTFSLAIAAGGQP
ncbi:hypothetical protein [Erythrobacter sp.]|uniref:hypothetical protein n=1 Tax=Erythrobacter sp. TaxID=1042 RepID=UPI001426014D|nr:hypothetical protein [Erythrobacter sp.]QIQ85685.1 MAG: hypothetical protein G9473_02530 [Erythrobacter sp.]